jgi:hypothetical protein
LNLVKIVEFDIWHVLSHDQHFNSGILHEELVTSLERFFILLLRHRRCKLERLSFFQGNLFSKQARSLSKTHTVQTTGSLITKLVFLGNLIGQIS